MKGPAGRLRPLANLHHEDVEFSGITFPAITRVYPELEPYRAINPYYGVYLHRSTPEPIVTQVAEAFVHAVQQERFKKLVVEQRSGIWSPQLGRASDELMSRIESARGWALYELGVAPRDPAEFGIPKLSDWRWPPHRRAAALKPWPQAVEALAQKLPSSD